MRHNFHIFYSGNSVETLWTPHKVDKNENDYRKLQIKTIINLIKIVLNYWDSYVAS